MFFLSPFMDAAFELGEAIGDAVRGVATNVYDDRYDYSDRSRYSEYADGAMLARIKEKEANLREQNARIERLRRLIRENLDEFMSELREDDDLAPFIPLKYDINSNGSDENERLNYLSAEAARRIENKLQADIQEDEMKLRRLDSVLQKINDMRFN